MCVCVTLVFSLPRSFSFLRMCGNFRVLRNRQKRKHFIFLFCFYKEDLGRSPHTVRRGGISIACPEQKELCGDLPTVKRFAIPFL